MAFGYAISELAFSGGTTVSLPAPGVVLIVGPNNVGKSQCLKEIAGKVGGHAVKEEFVVSGLRDRRSGTDSEFWAWLCEHYQVVEGEHETLRGFGVHMAGGLRRLVQDVWPTAPGLIDLGKTVLHILTTEERLNAAQPVQSFEARAGFMPDKPLQVLYLDEKLEERLSRTFRQAFGLDLLVDRIGGSLISLHCGQSPSAELKRGSSPVQYGRLVHALPLLHLQGDGMRSFVGCLLHAELRDLPILLIDEPEAFLHPPQALRLGQHLASTAERRKSQLFIATHSSDIVRGVIGATKQVAVVRLTRDGNLNKASLLEPIRVRELWEDPLLRASNLLDGLFHSHVVLCEADGDCKFYDVVLERVSEIDKVRRRDVLFSHTAGKDRLPVAIRAMCAIGVDVTVIADIDVLSAEQPLRGIWEALGRKWDEIERDATIVKSAVDATAVAPSVKDVRQRVLEALDATKKPLLDEGVAKELRQALRSSGGWPNVKKAGIAAIPNGDARAACDRVLVKLKDGGLHVVPVGELEGFAPSVPGKGPKWLAEVLSAELKNVLPSALDFVRGLALTDAPVGSLEDPASPAA